MPRPIPQRTVLERAAKWKTAPPRLAIERGPYGYWQWCTPAELVDTETPVLALRVDAGLSRTRLDALARLSTLIDVDLGAADRTNTDILRGLARLSGLQRLCLRGLPRTSAELAPLAGLPQLQHVALHRRTQPGFHDAPRPAPGPEGLALLAGLPRLHTLDLSGCEDLNDAVLRSLATSSTLRVLHLPATPRLTAAGLRRLQATCPGLSVRLPLGWLSNLLGHRLAWALNDLIEALLDGPDGPERDQGRDAWPALFATRRAPTRRWPVVADLLALGIARPTDDPLVNPCLERVVDLHRLGGDP
ncbi:MAG: hypothetical protein JRJ84_03310, partial [Deltaproteobacteria bacterium]|nr:hypothetical protein [Deltaproteobacteria bacterium]